MAALGIKDKIEIGATIILGVAVIYYALKGPSVPVTAPMAAPAGPTAIPPIPHPILI